MSVHFATSRTAASRVHPTGRVVWWGKASRHNSGVHSAAGKLAVAENGGGVFVGCLRQYQKRWGFVRMATSRAAWPKSIHDKQQQQQRELFFFVRLHRGAWRDRSGRHGGVFVGMDDSFTFTMDTPFIEINCLIELFEVYYLRPGWRNREW